VVRWFETSERVAETLDQAGSACIYRAVRAQMREDRVALNPGRMIRVREQFAKLRRCGAWHVQHVRRAGRKAWHRECQWTPSPTANRAFMRYQIRLAAVSAALLSTVLLPITAQSSARPNPARTAIERYLATVREHRFSNVKTWVSAQLAKTSELIYISSSGALNIYSPSGQSLGAIAAPSNGNFGNGVAVDAQQNVYVGGANSQDGWTVTEFARGATVPSRTLLLGTGGSDFSMGIALAKNGTVYAAQPYDYRIAVFAPGSTSPTSFLNVPPASAPPFSLTVDANGTLYALLAGSSSYPTSIAQYAHGKGTPVVAPYEVGEVGGFGIAADRKNHIVVTSGGSQPSIYVFLRNDPFWLEFGGPGNAGFLAFSRQSNRLYYGTVLDQGPAGVVQFPSLRSIRNLQTTDNSGIAVSPAVNV
jgi:hypothetical protein